MCMEEVQQWQRGAWLRAGVGVGVGVRVGVRVRVRIGARVGVGVGQQRAWLRRYAVQLAPVAHLVRVRVGIRARVEERDEGRPRVLGQ